MSEGLKRFEITLEVNSAEGSQTFACFADSELDARLKLGRGECEIIEQNLEVLGLDKEPIEIVESDDISSRLPNDILYQKLIELEQLRKELEQAQSDIELLLKLRVSTMANPSQEKRLLELINSQKDKLNK